MRAFVLAAGLGTRLQPLTRVRAKPAIPVAGEPMIRRIVEWLARHAVTDVVVNLHHLPHTVTAILGDGSDLAVRVRYSWEQPRILGTAGGPRQALDIVGSDTFAIVNGDTLTGLDLDALAEAHGRSGALVTMAVTPTRHAGRYGGIILDRGGAVAGFVPRGREASGSYHFVGVQIAQAAAFGSLSPGEPASSIGGLYDSLIATCAGSVRGFLCEARFWDIGTPADYLETSLAFASDSGRSALSHPGPRPIGRPTPIVRDSILWDDVTLGDGCMLNRCIVTDGVHVPAESSYTRAILIRAGGGEPDVFPLVEP